jgi:hypothetical protein
MNARWKVAGRICRDGREFFTVRRDEQTEGWPIGHGLAAGAVRIHRIRKGGDEILEHDCAAYPDGHRIRPRTVSIEDMKSGVSRWRRNCDPECRREKGSGIGKQIPPSQRGQIALSLAFAIRGSERGREGQASDGNQGRCNGKRDRSAQESGSGADVSVLSVGGAVKLHDESPYPTFPI